MYLEFSVQQLLSGQFHREVSPGKEHGVLVVSLRRATAAGADGESAVEEATFPV